MSDELDRIEEQSLDVLLSEVYGASGPRDFTHEIMTQLANSPANPNSVITTLPTTRSRRKSNNGRPLVPTRYLVGASLVAAVAASLVLFLWSNQRPDREPQGGPVIAQHSAPIESARVDIEATTTPPIAETKNTAPAPASEGSRLPPGRRGIPLVTELPNVATSDVSPVLDEDKPQVAGERPRQQFAPVQPQRNSPPLQFVSQHVDQLWHAYWQGVGVEPTPAVSMERVVQRVESSLGVNVPAAAIEDAEQLQRELAAPAAARIIVQHWLRSVAPGGLRRLNEDDRKALIAAIADPITRRQGFDTTLADLIGGRHPANVAWYTALGDPSDATMRNQLAMVSMNVDLRCTRCHDALIEGQGSLQDHWSFAAMLQNGLRPSETSQPTGSQWSVASSHVTDLNQTSLFYDLPDGRRRLAKPGVPAAWLGLDGEEPISNLQQWSQQLVGSRSLARGLVNSLWQTLHGRPLRGSVVDVDGSPHHHFLSSLEQELSDDLMASDFDLARCLALMIRSPAMRRSVPHVLSGEQALLASREHLQQTRQAMDAFAAAVPLQPTLPLDRKIAHVLRASGTSMNLAALEASKVLSQAAELPSKSKRNAQNKSPNKAKQSRVAEQPVEFPITAAGPPAGWLESIKEFEDQVEHLAYLSGRNRLPAPVAAAVEAMRQAQMDEDLMLQRTWWLLAR